MEEKNYIEVLKEVFDSEEIVKFRTLMVKYECAMLEVKTKLDVLNTELSLETKRNPFESIKCRIKSPKSIVNKLKRNNWPVTTEGVEKNLNDVAGIRVICSFQDDIYKLVEYLLSQDDITLIERKDYIKAPKKNGYRSYHLIIEVPIFLTTEKKSMRVEVQFRTIGMDFWASLEHKLNYKQAVENPDKIISQLYFCADLICQVDERMQRIREKIESGDREFT